jgi:hypothetical protein
LSLCFIATFAAVATSWAADVWHKTPAVCLSCNEKPLLVMTKEYGRQAM